MKPKLDSVFATWRESFPTVFPIIEVPQGAAESTEQLGTKYKFWYRDQNGPLTLYKQGRPGTGENWAEKVACELAELLGLPHARYELARYGDQDGVISENIVPPHCRLVHGNELLATVFTDYGDAMEKPYRRKEHSLRRVLGYFRSSADVVGAPIGFRRTNRVVTAGDVFVGYLMLDAWIANQDRHDENWGLIRTPEGNSFLAPSYDHGSSMGRNETDDRRKTMLATKDMGQHITKYVTTARSALYPPGAREGRLKALGTLEVFEQAGRLSRDAAREWQDRLSEIDAVAVGRIIAGVPANLMTDVARNFTVELLRLNRERVLACKIS